MRHFILIILCFLFAQNANAQDTTLAKFLMIGHAYGSQDTTVKQWKSIIDNAEKIKSIKADFKVLLGDLSRDHKYTTFETLRDSIIGKILKKDSSSIILVKGNHDVDRLNGRVVASARAGKGTYITQIENPDLSLDIFQKRFSTGFLYNVFEINSEAKNQNLDSLIKSATKNSQSPNIVFLSHRLIWAYSNPRYAHLVELTNSPAMHQLPQVVDMDFLNQQKDKKFYFFAGDLGVNIPLFYDKVGNVTMYAVGCGGTPKDAALLAEFKCDTILTSLVHLGTANYSIEDYSLEKINTMPLPNVTISAQQGFKGYQWPIVLGIFALMALALYMVVTPNE